MDRKTLRPHNDLDVWKKAMDLTAQVYSLTARFPKGELYGLTSQIRRSAVSIPSNIEEGAAKQSSKEFIDFPHIASGSVAELETQLLLATSMGFISRDNLLPQTQEIRTMLLGLVRFPKKKPVTHHSSLITAPL